MLKYQPLADYLAAQGSQHVTVTFAEIERLLAQPLPRSARRYRQWWENESRGQHSQARSWMETGWRVESANLTGEWVTFARSG